MFVLRTTTIGVLLMNCVSEASKLVMQSDSPVIHPVLTKTLKLRCSIYKDNPNLSPLTRATTGREEGHLIDADEEDVNETLAANGTVAPIMAPTSAVFTTPSPLSVSSGADVVHVMTVIINKDISGKNVTIASVTPFDPAATIYPFNETTFVEGGILTGSGADLQAYLQVTWANPREEDAGTYSCEIVALAAQGIPVTLTSTLKVMAEEPNFHDVVNYLVGHEKEITRLQRQNEALKRQLDELKANSSLASEQIQVRLNAMDTIQTGTFSCPSPTYILFPKPYTVTPIVFPTLVGLAETSSNDSTTFKIKFMHVGPNGFTADCGYTGYFIPEFQWLAIGQ